MRFNLVSSLVSAAIFAAGALAQGVQDGKNAFTAPLNGATFIAGLPNAITWKPETTGTISIHLLKGPASDLIETLVIAANIANSGTFTWTPDVALEGDQTMGADSGYGLKIVTDSTGNFEWSGHFVLSNPQSTFNAGGATGITASATTAEPTTSTPTSTPTTSTTESVASTTASTESPTSVTPADVSTTSTSSTTSSTSTHVSTTLSTPSSTASSISTTHSTTSTSAESTSAASTIASSTTAAPATTTSLPASSTTSSKSSTSAAATNASSSSSSPSASATAAVASKSTFSTYAIVGVSVGAVALIASIAMGFFLFRKRRQTRRESEMFGGRGTGAYDAEFAMMERSRQSGGFLSSNYNKVPEYPGNIGQAQSRF